MSQPDAFYLLEFPNRKSAQIVFDFYWKKTHMNGVYDFFHDGVIRFRAMHDKVNGIVRMSSTTKWVPADWFEHWKPTRSPDPEDSQRVVGILRDIDLIRGIPGVYRLPLRYGNEYYNDPELFVDVDDDFLAGAWNFTYSQS